MAFSTLPKCKQGIYSICNDGVVKDVRKVGKDLICIKQLDAQDIFNISTGYMDNDKIHSPIPLSEDVLVRSGFVNDTEEWEHIKCFVLGNFMWQDNGTFYYNYKEIDCKHLHQLQNLYYSLTGQELIYNTPIEK